MKKSAITMMQLLAFALVLVFTAPASEGIDTKAAIKKACEIAASKKSLLKGKARNVFIKNCIKKKSKKKKKKKGKKDGKKETAAEREESGSSSDGRSSGGSSGYTASGGFTTGKIPKVWLWNEKVLVTWKGPKKGKYMIYTTYYADKMDDKAFFDATHRGVMKFEHKGSPCAFDPRGGSEKERGYRYMQVFEVKKKTLVAVEMKFEEFKGNKPPGKCFKLNNPSM